MAVNTANILKGFHDATKAVGAKVISSDFALEIEGFEAAWLLCKQAPHPVIAPQGEIEIAGPLGMMMYQPQQVRTAFQGPITLTETRAGSVDTLLLNILRSGGTFDGKLYEGTPQKFIRYRRVQDCFLVLDVGDRNWDDRSTVLNLSGTMFGSFYGEIISGNSTDYR